MEGPKTGKEDGIGRGDGERRMRGREAQEDLIGSCAPAQISGSASVCTFAFYRSCCIDCSACMSEVASDNFFE